jgi:hypothetical protein
MGAEHGFVEHAAQVVYVLNLLFFRHAIELAVER